MRTPPLRSLAVDLEELTLAFEAEAADVRWFLDLQTGAVILVTAQFDPAEAGVTVEQLETDAARFMRVPEVDPEHLIEDMGVWATTVEDVTLRESLLIAMSAPRAEKRFKTALSWLPEQQAKWHLWRAERCAERMKNWLAEHGLHPTS